MVEKNRHQKTTHRQTSSSSLIVASSFGLSNFKLRGVLSSLRSRLLCTWNQKILIVPKNKKEQKLREWTFSWAITGSWKTCISPRGVCVTLRGYPAGFSGDKLAAPCVLNQMTQVQPRWSPVIQQARAVGRRCTSYFMPPKIERKKKSEKAQLSEITAKKSACWWRAVPLHPLPASLPEYPWC